MRDRTVPEAIRRPDGEVYDRRMGAGASEAGARITAFVLAGGKSSRMGADKAFLIFAGESLLSRALAAAGAITPDVRIVGSAEKFGKYGLVVEDRFRECGPLGGIHAALGSLSGSPASEWNLMLAVDMPFVSSALLEYLLEQAKTATGAMVVVPQCAGKLQPLCAIYRRGFYGAAEKALQAGRNKIDSLFDEMPVRVIEENEWQRAGFSREMFRNLNTATEFAEAGRSATLFI